jgi:hypothetical protein
MNDDKKQLNIDQTSAQNNTPLSLYELSSIKDNPDSIYLHQKSERLTSALYMLSGLLSDSEPLKSNLRSLGLDLLNQTFNLSDRPRFTETLVKTLSLLEVARLAGLISQMNHNIFRFEIESLIRFAESLADRDRSKIIFPEHFLDVPRPIVEPSKSSHFSPSQLSVNPAISTMSDRLSVKKQSPKPQDKSNRQDIIIGLLKKSPELGIKDFVSAISDCSEKTIQRELVSLTNKGLIRKKGEKRWSRYSLK